MVHFPQLMLDFLLGRITFAKALEQSWNQQRVSDGKSVCNKDKLRWSINNREKLDEILNWLDYETKQLHRAHNHKTTCPECIKVLKKHNL